MSTTSDQNGAPDPALVEEISGQIPQPILAQLACPACHGSLAPNSTELICDACGRRYPIVEGIPVLIEGREQL